MSLVIDGVTYGLTPEGFNPKTNDVITTEFQADVRGANGADLRFTAASALGQFSAIICGLFAEVWEVLAAVVSATDPDNAEGEPLVQVCAVTGTVPEDPLPSTTTLACTGTAGTVLLAPRTATTGTGSAWDTLEDATLVAAAAWAPTTTYALKAFVSNGGSVYTCTGAGTSAGSGGPSGNGDAIADGSVTWEYVGSGAAYALVNAQCEDDGPTVALAGAISTISTPVAGWSNVVNLADAVLGRGLETDAQLRTRREAELIGDNGSVIHAINKALDEVAGVTSVLVYANQTGSTDADGRPPYSVEALVRGGADQDITDAVGQVVAGGITTYGNQSGTWHDAVNDVDYAIAWSRPVEEDVYVTIAVTTDPDSFPADGAARVTAAILAFGAAFVTGKDVVSSAVGAQAFVVPGVLDMTSCKIGLAPSPGSSATLVMTVRELAVFDSSRVVVNVT